MNDFHGSAELGVGSDGHHRSVRGVAAHLLRVAAAQRHVRQSQKALAMHIRTT